MQVCTISMAKLGEEKTIFTKSNPPLNRTDTNEVTFISISDVNDSDTNEMCTIVFFLFFFPSFCCSKSQTVSAKLRQNSGKTQAKLNSTTLL